MTREESKAYNADNPKCDLISRAEVLKHIDRHRKYHTKWQDIEGLIRDDYAENFIKKAPSVSAERVVLCKDCDIRNENGWCEFIGGYVHDGYCAWAKMKGGE